MSGLYGALFLIFMQGVYVLTFFVWSGVWVLYLCGAVIILNVTGLGMRSRGVLGRFRCWGVVIAGGNKKASRGGCFVIQNVRLLL
jgi:hypothetical protein